MFINSETVRKTVGGSYGGVLFGLVRFLNSCSRSTNSNKAIVSNLGQAESFYFGYPY